MRINPLNAELNPIRHLLALVGARHIVHVSRIRVNCLTLSFQSPCGLSPVWMRGGSAVCLRSVSVCVWLEREREREREESQLTAPHPSSLATYSLSLADQAPTTTDQVPVDRVKGLLTGETGCRFGVRGLSGRSTSRPVQTIADIRKFCGLPSTEPISSFRQLTSHEASLLQRWSASVSLRSLAWIYMYNI